jgi:hypothetical protein
MWYMFWMTNRWLLLNFDALGALAVLVTMLLSIATLADGAAGLAGLCITSAMAFTTSGISYPLACLSLAHLTIFSILGLPFLDRYDWIYLGFYTLPNFCVL